MKKSNYARILILVLSLALLIGSVMVVTAMAEEAEVGSFGSASVAYTDKVCIRIVVNATETQIKNGEVVVNYSFKDSDTVKTAKYYETDEDNRVWVITDGIAAYDMAREVVFSSTANSKQVEAGRTYSVAQFLYKMLYTKSNITEAYKNLYQSLLKYGEAAQIALNQNADKLITSSTIVTTKNADVTINGVNFAFAAAGTLEVTPVWNGAIDNGAQLNGWKVLVNGEEQTVSPTFTASGVVEIVSPVFKNHVDADNNHLCDDCGATVSECTAGKATKENVVNATCITKGSYDSVVRCTVCTKELSRTTETTAANHTWGNGTTANDITTYTCSVCGVIKAESAKFEANNNTFVNKEFTPTADALANIYAASLGYPNLTDGKRDHESQGRFATKLAATAFIDATIDLTEKYSINTLTFYLYDTQYAKDKAGSIGKDMLIQVYVDGNWYDVVNCVDNASICEYLTIIDGDHNDYVQFNLGGIVAEKIRVYISAPASTSGTTFEEIECNAAPLNTHVHIEQTLAGSEATCVKPGMTAGVLCSDCKEILDAQEVIPAKGHSWSAGTTENGITTYSCNTCGLTKAESDTFTTVGDIFDGKTFTPSADAAANMYNANYGYQTLTDGIIYQEGSGRYSSKSDGGKVEASIDLGAVYALSEFKIYLHKDGLSKFGTGLTISVLVGDKWVPVIVCETPDDLQKYWVDNPDSATMDWLVFDLGGVTASSVKFTIPGQQASTGWTTVYEMECSGAATVVADPDAPVIIENVFAGKQFTPTEEAKAQVLIANWFAGGGYDKLTDKIKTDDQLGRFSTVMKTTGMVDATIDLGGSYNLHSFKLFTYDPAAGTNAGGVGKDLLIQVYANGEWTDVVTCADNAAIMAKLVVNEGIHNDYLEFDLGGVEAEKVRIYISASASSSGTTFQEIECTGYAK